MPLHTGHGDCPPQSGMDTDAANVAAFYENDLGATPVPIAAGLTSSSRDAHKPIESDRRAQVW